MKNKYGIGFFSIALILILVITCASQLSYQKAKERAEARIAAKENEETERTSASAEDDSIATEGQALKEDCYYLMDVNGFVVVYLADRKTPYEYTDIICDGLPETIQQELRNGKYIESTEELYGFLENYSS